MYRCSQAHIHHTVTLDPCPKFCWHQTTSLDPCIWSCPCLCAWSLAPLSHPTTHMPGSPVHRYPIPFLQAQANWTGHNLYMLLWTNNRLHIWTPVNFFLQLTNHIGIPKDPFPIFTKSICKAPPIHSKTCATPLKLKYPTFHLFYSDIFSNHFIFLARLVKTTLRLIQISPKVVNTVCE